MYQISRAIYRELARDIVESDACGSSTNHERVLQACETAIERLATDRHYFARPARTLFGDIRVYFPMCSQERVLKIVDHYMTFANDYFARLPRQGYDVHGNVLQCRATTRKGTACQRMPLPHNGYCPSHQHLAITEDTEHLLAA